MRTYRTSVGPFSERPFYKPEEIDQICLEELKSCGLYPDEPTAIRIDRFIEKRFGIVPCYEGLLNGVMGLTEFGSHGVRRIVVERSLEEEGKVTAERRIRTTFAHEAGHGLLHAHLFAIAAESKIAPLFGDHSDPSIPKVLCRDEIAGVSESSNKAYNGKWWEYQANQAIGALLLPKGLVEQSLKPFLAEIGTLGFRSLDPDKRCDAIRHVSDVFDVNPVVARIRIEGMYPVRETQQLRL